MADCYDAVFQSLSKIVLGRTAEYLSGDPSGVFSLMMEDGVPLPYCRAVLSILSSGMHYEAALKDATVDRTARAFARECLLNDEASLLLARVFTDLFAGPVREVDAPMVLCPGFREFCDGHWSYAFTGEDRWNSRDGGYADCSCDIECVYRVNDHNLLMSLLEDDLASDLDVEAEELCATVSDALDQVIRDRLHEFVSAGSDFEPCMDSFPEECRPAMEAFMKKYGLQMVDFQGSGFNGGFENDYDTVL